MDESASQDQGVNLARTRLIPDLTVQYKAHTHDLSNLSALRASPKWFLSSTHFQSQVFDKWYRDVIPSACKFIIR